MWTYTLYMLDAFIRRRGKYSNIKFKFEDFSNFVFEDLWKNQKIVFHDTAKDLLKDVRYLGELNLVQYNENSNRISITDGQYATIRKITVELKNDPIRERVPLVATYINKIEASVPTRAPGRR